MKSDTPEHFTLEEIEAMALKAAAALVEDDRDLEETGEPPLQRPLRSERSASLMAELAEDGRKVVVVDRDGNEVDLQHAFVLRADPEAESRRRSRHMASLAASVMAMVGVPMMDFDAAAFAKQYRAIRGQKHVESSASYLPRIAGSRRNEPCPCGCGKKRKRCSNGHK